MTGSFVYDRNSDTFSNILVSDSSGNNYNFAGPKADASQLQFVIDDPGNLALNDTPSAWGDLEIPGMTNAGGTVPLVTDLSPATANNPNSSITTCLNADCQIGGNPDYLVSGSITGVIVPEPGTISLIGLGLGLVALKRRR